MPCYVLQFDLQNLAAQLSLSLGCRLTAVDVREFLNAAGLIESQQGWLADDLRPLALAFGKPGGILC